MTLTDAPEDIQVEESKKGRGRVPKAPKPPKAPKVGRASRTSAPKPARGAQPGPARGRAAGTPALARVDLIPPIVEARRRQNALERMLMLGLIGLALVAVAAGFVVSLIAVGAEARLADEQALSVQLLKEQNSFSEVSTVKTQLVDYDSAELAALYAEADWPRLMRELDAALPADVQITSEAILVKGTDPTGAPPTADIGLDNLGVIQVDFTVTGPGVGSTTALLNGLQSLTGFASATATALVNSEGGYTITGTIQLNASALGGTARTNALDPEALTVLHDALLTAVTVPAAPAAPADDSAITEGEG